MKSLAVFALLNVVLIGSVTGQEPWSITSPADWTQAEATVKNVTIQNGTVALEAAGEGQWTSKWHAWQGIVDTAKVEIGVKLDMFSNKNVEVVVKGSEKPYTDPTGVPNDWYGRCMLAIVDQNRWIMTLRSGVDHIAWGDGDAIHLLTSSDEGRTWGKLNQWFDGTPITGLPYYDGKTHSEPGLFKMPNGDLILQFWKSCHTEGTKQLRSTDNGKTWVTDIDRIRVVGVTGVPEDMAIGTEDYFVDPENPSDVYMAFQYYHMEQISPKYTNEGGSILARSRDNGKSYTFLSWMAPTTCDNFEPGIEYVGNRTIVAVLRGTHNDHTWQAKSTDMGASFSPPVDISDQINGGVPKGLWQRARLYKESNPFFQHNNPLNFARGEGRLWGFGIHSIGGGYTRKPAVWWSDDNGITWHGPELLHGPMQPGTDTGYGDLKRRVDGTFVAATYYCPPSDMDTADVEQYTFGDVRAKIMIEADRDGDGKPDTDSGWRELYDGPNTFSVSGLEASRWRLRLLLRAADPTHSPNINSVIITPQ